MIHKREMLEHPVITEMERWGEVRSPAARRAARCFAPQGLRIATARWASQ